MINRPPILVSNQRHPPLSLRHIVTYLLPLLAIHHHYPNSEIRLCIPPVSFLFYVETRARLVGMRQAGLSFRAIAEWNNLPLTTVYNTFQKYEEIGTVTTQRKSGQPTKLTEHDRRQLSRIITRCKYSRIAPKKPYLRPQDFQRRLTFAQAHRHWTINEWAKVI
ncbi:hypothetical protein O181_122276 [Austropuccinia psidii MF-1]|uniref:Transposase Tc1-like domain-containing protein n=1 Tax=Austropuccinia psidii MF-1 TaxID=1389203 RepID=A0A9Q3Q272_9BASI|nr:hypothetical protein [Austropuccinia psidii MF-1]